MHHPNCDHHGLGQKSDPVQIRLQSQRSEYFDCVRRHLHAGANFTKGRRTLKNACLYTVQLQSARQCRTTNTASDDSYFQSFRHTFHSSSNNICNEHILFIK
ncbi:hypothetical protein TKWG_01090 [Advenella kashmirensis WT001]|uniref:Uncharacterized protein n=1 Tax=Advenella kashmirensis (strain DSM 17095 / LMG 22695 / WT001) TaxID=1036672 RepID=I3U7B5_ADVKW|nr:hypothetical protein TKWG_01090 [Advenella kashmirensis WT001]